MTIVRASALYLALAASVLARTTGAQVRREFTAVHMGVPVRTVRYSHVIDPRTGLGVPGRHIVTVIAADGALADASATALSVLGPDRAATFRKKYPNLLVSFRVLPQGGREP
jgi:hypothetical protein